MKIQLNITERVALPEVFQDKGSLAEQLTKAEIIKKIQFTEEEWVRFGIKVEEDKRSFHWNKTVDTATEIEFTEVEMALMRASCLKLDQDKEITMQTLPICRKILGI